MTAAGLLAAAGGAALLAAAPEVSPRPRPPIPASNIKGPAALLELCDLLRPEETVTFAGNEVARAKARAEHRRRRVEAGASNYLAEVPPDGYRFKDYDLADKRLSMDTSRSFVLADGVELSSADRDVVLDFELEPDVADRLLKARESRKLVLRLMFRPARPEMTPSPCIRQAGGRLAKLAIDVLSYELVRADGSSAAHGETPDLAEAAASATPVTAPQVTVRRPSAAAAEVSDGVASAVKALGPPLLPCYEKALENRPGLRGTVVVGLRVTADGRIADPQMEVSSLGDEAAVSCMLGRLSRVRLPKATPAMRLSVPFAFGSKTD